MEKPVLICSQPDDSYFVWQLDVFLDNNIKLGVNNETHVLWFVPFDRLHMGINPKVKQLESKYSQYLNIKFFYYEDTDGAVGRDINKIGYIPLLRPFCLKEHFKENPHLVNSPIFYHDCDILFTRKFPVERYTEDEVCYLSNTAGYLNLEYLEGKIEQSEKSEQLRKQRVVETIAQQVGISRDTIVQNNQGTGGAQYLLKGVDFQFWEDVYTACLVIRPYFRKLNSKFFKSENDGWQSWCADMWAVLWNLWKRNKKTECPTDFDFCWATDPIEKVDKVYIYHNAGVTGEEMDMNGEKVVMFNKGTYAGAEMSSLKLPEGATLKLENGSSVSLPKNSEVLIRNYVSPFSDTEYLQVVSPKYASHFYANKLLQVTNPIK